MSDQHKAKPHRLTENNYIGCKLYFITIDCCNRKQLFPNESFIKTVWKILQTTGEQYHFRILLATFMRDHIHMLLRGLESDSNLKNLLKTFKFRATESAKQERITDGVFWHKDYYDHIVRNETAVPKIIRYILENPVRKGYVSEYLDWPYAFSDEYDLKDFKEIGYSDNLDFSRL